MISVTELSRWLNQREDSYHDFKARWYHKGQKQELVKDLFSFVNTAHHKDCFLIIGVSDNREVIGVENNGNDRLNQQQLIDFLRKLPISGDFIPHVMVETLSYKNHNVDIIRIPNTDNVPVYLNQTWYEKGNHNNPIHAGQIFVREEDVNTARTETADYNQVEKLWQKHFRMDVPIIERYKYVLNDATNWSYYENDAIGFLYNLNPDFNMLLVEDANSTSRSRVESYSIDQIRTDIDWQLLQLKYRQLTIEELLVVNLDGARSLMAAPAIGSIGDTSEKLYYYCFIEDTIKYGVQQLLESCPSMHPDSGSLSSFYRGIANFKSTKEKTMVEEFLNGHYSEFIKVTKPSEDELKLLHDQLLFDFNQNSQEVGQLAIEKILQDRKTGEIIKQVVEYYRATGKWPDKIN
ncbi:MAG: ATP-binding protein [Liquorilactobacillus satsumensis]|uniref:ATP-binding protein n=1 Tax=Liquorilactobacillus TaxID=2767888 RepID=UPI0039E8DC27